MLKPIKVGNRTLSMDETVSVLVIEQTLARTAFRHAANYHDITIVQAKPAPDARSQAVESTLRRGRIWGDEIPVQRQLAVAGRTGT